ncbi:MAG TPA: RlmE family RNA methyltransferase [Candidatus Bathyarchaeia archaeon]|nr:RlmE family RNA methyltransferase [Candidatus Bathyarchaeia archaeon]
MPKSWARERQRDYFYRRAKEEQLRSRAAFKLSEAVERYRLIRRGDVVVDLGAAPGGWMVAALWAVGERGFVLGVDVRSVEPFEAENSRSIIADVTEPEVVDTIRGFLPDGLADVVVSDVSPNVSGIWEVDQARQLDLARRSLYVAACVLRRGGNVFFKVFQGDMLDGFVSDMRREFRVVRFLKPKASRKTSSELFLMGFDKL